VKRSHRKKKANFPG